MLRNFPRFFQFSFLLIFNFDFSFGDSINSSAFNWKHCTMFVQDIKSLGVNITAEISRAEADNFKEMCTIFASDSLYEYFLDECISNLPQLQPPKSVSGSNLSLNSSTSNKSNASKSSAGKNNKKSASVSSDELDKLTIDELLADINEIIEEDPFPLLIIQLDITNILTKHIKNFNADFTIVPFGARVCGLSHLEDNSKNLH